MLEVEKNYQIVEEENASNIQDQLKQIVSKKCIDLQENQQKENSSPKELSQSLIKKVCKPLNAISSKQSGLQDEIKQQKREVYLKQLEFEMEKENKRMKYYPKAGSYEFSDVADKIKLVRIAQIGDEVSLKCVVEWKERQNGIKPEISLIDYREIKKHDPLMMINYYESRLVRKNGLPYKPKQIVQMLIEEQKINQETKQSQEKKQLLQIENFQIETSEKDVISQKSISKTNEKQSQQIQLQEKVLEMQQDKLTESEILLEDEDIKEDNQKLNPEEQLKLQIGTISQEEQKNIVIENNWQKSEFADINFGLDDMDDNEDALFLINQAQQN